MVETTMFSPAQIKRLRQIKKWTQSDLAENCGVDPVTVCRWENDQSTPNPRAMRMLRRLSIERPTLNSGVTLREMVEGYRGPAAISDLDNRILCISRYICCFYAQMPSELIGHDWVARFEPESVREAVLTRMLKHQLDVGSAYVDHTRRRDWRLDKIAPPMGQSTSVARSIPIFVEDRYLLLAIGEVRAARSTDRRAMSVVYNSLGEETGRCQTET